MKSKILIVIKLLALMNLNVNSAQEMEITPLFGDNGYTIIKLNEMQLVDNYSKILHIVDLDEYQNLINTIETNIDSLNLQETNPNSLLLVKELEHLKQNYETIIPSVHRNKRGLLNVLGSGLKFIAGTMDADDAKQISDYMDNLKQNTQQLTEQSNKQITINQKLINSIENIKTHINNQQQQIQKYLSKIITETNKIIQDDSKYVLQIYVSIAHINKEIDGIKDIILLSKLNVLAHDILSPNEIQDFNITMETFPFIKSSVILKERKIILAILIPKFTIEKYFSAIVIPFPNQVNQELDISNENIIVSEKKVIFTFEKQIVEKKELKTHKNNCISNLFNKNNTCNFKINNKPSIEEIDSGLLITKNIEQCKLSQNCQKDDAIIEKHNLIKFINCDVTINDLIFVNKIKMYQNKIMLPMLNLKINKIINNLTLDNVNLENIENRKIIKYIDFKNKIFQYSLSSVIFIIIFTVIIVIILRKYCQSNKINTIIQKVPDMPNIENGTLNNFSGTEKSRCGGVIYGL